MVFWKIDDETIRCLINRQEIDNMGYDIDSLNEDHEQMQSFLNAIVQSSQNYIEWHTENGIQNYMARALPADQFLITISCTFVDDIIDRNLEQIEKMTKALNTKITPERLEEIFALSGEEKERAFAELSQDLQEVCNPEEQQEEEQGETPGISVKKPLTTPAMQGGDSPSEEPEVRDVSSVALPARKLMFTSFDALLDFVAVLDEEMFYPSTLYKCGEEFILLVRFDQCKKNRDAVSFIITAEEYGGKCDAVKYEAARLLEHGSLMIADNAIEVLYSMR